MSSRLLIVLVGCVAVTAAATTTSRPRTTTDGWWNPTTTQGWWNPTTTNGWWNPTTTNGWWNPTTTQGWWEATTRSWGKRSAAGGFSSERDATAEIQALVDMVEAEFEQRTAFNIMIRDVPQVLKYPKSEFTAVRFRTQLVNGVNYLVKVHLGNNDYAHLTIYKPFVGQGEVGIEEPTLANIELRKQLADPIAPKRRPTRSIVPGGLNGERPATPQIQAMADLVQSQFEERNLEKVLNSDFTAVSYRRQVVAGMNYYIKVHLGGERYAHLKVHKPLASGIPEPELVDFQTSMLFEDPIAFF